MTRSAAGMLFLLAFAVALGGYSILKARPYSSAAANEQRDEFAQDRVAEFPTPAPFDEKRAMGYLEAICRLGPRISGSEGMKKQQELLQKHFETLGAKVELQRFTGRQNSRPQPVELANMIVSWHPDRKRRVIFCSHYDTRPIADQEPNRRHWQEPFLSANDGGSGVALLMEMANHMKELKTTVGVDFVFFDAEEYIFEREKDRYFIGSEHFATMWRRSREKPEYMAAILLDMVGGKNARFPGEQHSLFKAGALVEQVWRVAAQLKCSAFVTQVGPAVMDDHLALNEVGIPAIDIIDFDYPHWHRLTDTPANCSGESLAQVAKVLGVWVQMAR